MDNNNKELARMMRDAEWAVTNLVTARAHVRVLEANVRVAAATLMLALQTDNELPEELIIGRDNMKAFALAAKAEEANASSARWEAFSVKEAAAKDE